MGALTAYPNAIQSMLVNYSDFSNDPSSVTGALLRKQYEDYVNRYSGVENALMDMTSYNNPNLVSDELATSKATVTGAMNTANTNKQYGYQRLGMTPTVETQQANAARSSLNTSTAVVDAANRIRQRISDRNQLIAVGAVPNAGRAYGLSSATTGE